MIGTLAVVPANVGVATNVTERRADEVGKCTSSMPLLGFTLHSSGLQAPTSCVGYNPKFPKLPWMTRKYHPDVNARWDILMD